MREVDARVYAQRLKIMPHYSIVYSREITASYRSTRMPMENKAKGDVSYKAGVRIRNCMNWLVYFSEPKFVARKKPKKSFWFKLNFITLTLSCPQTHTDTYIVTHLLQPFLKYIARKYGATNYIWKAEIQPDRFKERGERCIHFHITTNKFCPKEQIMHKWNSLQVAHGYNVDILNSPSTNVKAVVSLGKIVSYMSKYIMKKPESKDLCVTSKIWGCSHALSNLSVLLKEEDCSDFGSAVKGFVERFVTHTEYKDYCAILYTDLKKKEKMPDIISERIAVAREIFNRKENGVIGYLYEEKKPLQEIKKMEKKKVALICRQLDFDLTWRSLK